MSGNVFLAVYFSIRDGPDVTRIHDEYKLSFVRKSHGFIIIEILFVPSIHSISVLYVCVFVNVEFSFLSEYGSKCHMVLLSI